MDTSKVKKEKMLMEEFGYLIEKVKSAGFQNYPFKFILIENFLSKEHFDQITSAKEINRPEAATTENLIDDLLAHGYIVHPFPGCTTSVEDYLACYNSKKWPTDKGLLEGYGLTFRLKNYQTPVIERLVDFLNLPEFKLTLEQKFGITEPNFVESAVHKYLHGYEISPHPDIRKKAATYMLNINTSDESEKLSIHTYLMKFKPEKEYVYDFWRKNKKIQRSWVPWDWCESVLETRANNSIVLFAPDDDTVHAVKLDYDHLKFQRTQLYGNLWYNEPFADYDSTYQDIASRDIDIDRIMRENKKIREESATDSLKKKLKSILPDFVVKGIKSVKTRS